MLFEVGLDECDIVELLVGIKVDEQYLNYLDWFLVDLEGEKLVMDGWIFE